MYHQNSRYGRLFSTYDIVSASESTIKKMREEIRSLSKSDFERATIQQLAQEMVAKHSAIVPTIDRANVSVSKPRDAQIDLGRDQWGESHRAAGTAIDVHIPFVGDCEMFKFKPSRGELGPPAAEIVGDEVKFTIADVRLEHERVRGEIETRLDSIEKYLTNLRRDVEGHEEHLRRAAIEAVSARSKKLDEDDALSAGLGFKIRE